MKFPPLLLAFGIFAGFGPAFAQAEDTIQKGSVVLVPLAGTISSAQMAFLRRTLKQAESKQAQAFVMEMDTPGGDLQAGVDILQLLLKARIPTYTWVNTNAGSAGALIALASDHIYMAPVSAIGAAAPVMSGGQDIPETMQAKTVSYYSGYFRSAAEAKGRNPGLAQAFIDKTKGFKVGDTVFAAPGSLLTLSAQEATRKFNNKPLLADGLASSIDELTSKSGLNGPIVRVEPSGFERIAQLITLLAPLFLIAGIAAAYLEFKAPGFGVAGIVALACFAIFFLGHYIAGLTGFEVMVAFALGFLMVALELFFFPGVTIIALLGIALMLGSLLFAMIDYFPGDPWIPTPEMLLRPAINLGLTLTFSALAITLFARFFPSLPFFRRLVLATSDRVGPSLELSYPTAFGGGITVGELGVALSILRPSGRAQFGERVIDVVTDGEFLDPGTPLQVAEITGSRVLVTQTFPRPS